METGDQGKSPKRIKESSFQFSRPKTYSQSFFLEIESLPRPGWTEPELREAFEYVLEQLDNPGFDFDHYDQDGDGVLDSVVFLHSGYGAERGSVDCETGTSWENRIWSHAMMRAKDDAWVSKSGKVRLGAYMVTSAYRGRCYTNIARIGLVVHEYLHTLGLPDLYGTSGSIGPALGGLAGYDTMANPGGQSYRQAWPGFLSPWSKKDAGWLDPIEIVVDGTYTMRPSELYQDVYMIRQGYADGEFLMMENRQPLFYDAYLWTGGVLIYHVDENVSRNGNGRPGFPGSPRWPSNGNHQKIALLQADGRYQVDMQRSNGDANDFYRFRDQELGPGNGEAVATMNGTYPNTDSYVKGKIVVTGIIIDNFHEIEPMVWSFDVKGLGKKGTTPVTDEPTRGPSSVPTLVPTIPPTPRPFGAPSAEVLQVFRKYNSVILDVRAVEEIERDGFIRTNKNPWVNAPCSLVECPLLSIAAENLIHDKRGK
jgi:M6 family metalloprotease-like protein